MKGSKVLVSQETKVKHKARKKMIKKKKKQKSIDAYAEFCLNAAES